MMGITMEMGMKEERENPTFLMGLKYAHILGFDYQILIPYLLTKHFYRNETHSIIHKSIKQTLPQCFFHYLLSRKRVGVHRIIYKGNLKLHNLYHGPIGMHEEMIVTKPQFYHVLIL